MPTAAVPAFTVSVELPPAVTDVGLSDALAPLGAPVTERLTVPALPEVTAVEIELVPEALCWMIRLVGLAAIEKSLVAKFPVTVAGALGMWKLVLAEVLESNVPPVEVQLLNVKPALAVAVTGIVAPEAK